VTAFLCIGAFVVAVAAVMFIVDRGSKKMLQGQRDGVAHLARALGLPAPAAGSPMTLDGTTAAGVAFRLETTRERTGRGFRGVLTMTGRPRRPLPTVVVQNRRREGLDAPAALATIRVGDAVFDEAFVVHASNEDEAKALLTPALRALLLGDPNSAVLRAEMLRVSEAEVALSYPAVAPGLYEPSRLESIARQVLELCG
jgi:hypothetical protein